MGEYANFSVDETWQTWCHLAQNLRRIPKPLRLVREAARVGWKVHGLLVPLATMLLRPPPFGCEIADVHLSTPSGQDELACACSWCREKLQMEMDHSLLENEEKRKRKKTKKKKEEGRRPCSISQSGLLNFFFLVSKLPFYLSLNGLKSQICPPFI